MCIAGFTIHRPSPAITFLVLLLRTCCDILRRLKMLTCCGMDSSREAMRAQPASLSAEAMMGLMPGDMTIC